MYTSLNLYAVRVGNSGSFFVAAADIDQAKAIGEAWRERNGIHESARVTAKRHKDSRPVFVPA